MYALAASDNITLFFFLSTTDCSYEKQYVALQIEDFQLLYQDESSFVFARCYAEQRVLVAINLGHARDACLPSGNWG
ncbi:hypothetical protein ACT691_18040 [Vibrio metschnikovii]